MSRRKYVMILLMVLALVLLALSCAGGQQPNVVVEEFPICIHDAGQGNPDISGNIVVWSDGRNEGFASIYGYNLETKTEFLVYTVKKTQRIISTIASLDVSGNIVVWEELFDDSGYDIWGCDLETGEIFPVCTDEGHQREPVINGDLIAWKDKNSPNYYQIEVYDLATEQIVFSLSGDVCDISGDIIVWENSQGIFGYNLKSGIEFPISTSGYEGGVAISGNTVVWIDYSPTSHHWQEHSAGDIIVYDLETREKIRLPETWTRLYFPVVNGDLVVWTNDIHRKRSIQGYDLRTERSFTISTAADRPGIYPDVDGDIIVWGDVSSGNPGVYGARILRTSE